MASQKRSYIPKTITPEFCETMAEALLEFARMLRRDRRAPGRPKREDVTHALKLELEGATRRAIYQQLGKNSKPEQHSLREAMRMRKHREKRKAVTPKITPMDPASMSYAE